MRTAILTLFTSMVLGKLRKARIQDLLNNVSLPDTQHIIETLKPHGDKFGQIAHEEINKINSHFKDARANYEQK